MKRIFFSGAVLAFLVMIFSFNNQVKPTGIVIHKNTKTNYAVRDTAIPVKLQLEKTNMKDMFVLLIPDTAGTDDSIKDVFSKDYRELMQYMQKNKLQPLKFMAWYNSTQAPWILEVGIETSGIPSQLTGRIRSKTLKGSEVLIVHMWGPYDQLGQAYAEIQKWLKENNRKEKAAPFEVYKIDPAMVKDPSQIQTDVYQPIE
jgi:effector-binding domain-containing protein